MGTPAGLPAAHLAPFQVAIGPASGIISVTITGYSPGGAMARSRASACSARKPRVK